MKETDLKWVAEERNDPEVRKWFRQSELLSIEQQSLWFNTTDMRSYVAVDDDGHNIGVLSLSYIDPIARKCEFSIMIIPEYRGKGYGKKALWELLLHAFYDLNMEQVYSDVFATNPALDKYIKWGFKEYGKLPNWYYKNGQYIDSVIISITKDEYYNSLQQTLPKHDCPKS
jgi:RimJ/RimL family protein N-acetyltransferase